MSIFKQINDIMEHDTVKTVFGLDLGTASVGWAVVKECVDYSVPSLILGAGVRTYPLSVDESDEFLKGKSITTNATRRLKHSARLNNHRYKLRRETLKKILEDNGFISSSTLLCEDGEGSTFATLKLRAKAASERVSLEDLARVFLLINKKRGYKSSRKATQEDDMGEAVNGIDVANELIQRNITPGQLCLERHKRGVKKMPDFYRSDLQAELEKIYLSQRRFYTLLPDDFIELIRGKNESQTWAIIAKLLDLKGLKRVSSRSIDRRVEETQWRVDALSSYIDSEQFATVISKINGQISRASGLLSEISDRSKELVVNGETIGQYMWRILSRNQHYSFKNKPFYRQDYMDEFDRIWSVQSQFHTELTDELEHQLRDLTIFYQRPLKSQKSNVAVCELEGKIVEIKVDGAVKKKEIGPKVAPKSSPVFQDFRMWQSINNLRINDAELTVEEKQQLADELTYAEKLTDKQIAKLLRKGQKNVTVNMKELSGNTTMAAILKCCMKILEDAGYPSELYDDLSGETKVAHVAKLLENLGIDSAILSFDASLQGREFEMQPAYRLWHLLYSFEGDDSRSGNEKLVKKLMETFGMSDDAARSFAARSFKPDYGSLSVKAIKRLMPHLKKGLMYSEACAEAGYNHSARSLTKEQLKEKVYVDCIELLPKNALRNPVVEKILNQMINVVNSLVKQYGRPDEIRIELARELKKSAKEREDMTKSIASGKKENERIAALLKEAPFNLKHPGRNDIIRYKLYEELSDNGYKTLYSDTYIPREQLFSKNFNVEHIIPQASLFDDSFANKTLETTAVNIQKGNMTAMDFVESAFGSDATQFYRHKVEALCKSGKIGKRKCKNLLTRYEEIPSDFINRDLRDTQYISRKAKELLESMVPHVVATTGAITDKLREDWHLTELMKELNWNKYDRQGLTSIIPDKDGRPIRRIEGWTKRNDNRHHAMDAITIAFTRPEFIQYLNNLNARSDKSGSIYGIERKHIYRDTNGNRRFKAPMPLNQFRAEAKRVLDSILVSFKAKNKVVTSGTNTIKKKDGLSRRTQLTPRGALHNETVYGRRFRYVTSDVKIGAKMTPEVIATIASPLIRAALTKRLAENGGDPKKAFTGKNSVAKNPIYLDAMHSCYVPEKVKTVTLEPLFTVRKEITPDLKVDKVIDCGVKRVLEQRLAEFGGDPKKAFSNLDENPIYLNREKGIVLKRVRIQAVKEAIPLHSRRNKFGQLILDEKGRSLPVDYVQTSGNHHVALFETPSGKLEEVVVSFFEATTRAIAQPPLPVVDRSYRSDEGWRLLMTLKRNEYIVFPRYEEATDGSGEMVKSFDPHEVDLQNPDNYHLISPNLFRVQKLATRNYVFRHHLETNVEEVKSLRGITWKRIQTIDLMREAVKVRVDNTGRIVHVGEY